MRSDGPESNIRGPGPVSVDSIRQDGT